MDLLWTWNGEFFGYKEKEDLWTYTGFHVGQFHGHEVYGCDGFYLGEILSKNRLVRSNAKFNLRKSSFVPLMKRARIDKHANYVRFALYVGYEDFLTYIISSRLYKGQTQDFETQMFVREYDND